MTPQEFNDLSNHLIGKTIRAIYPGGSTTIGIDLDDGTFFTLTARSFDLEIANQTWWIPRPAVAETLVSEPSDGIL